MGQPFLLLNISDSKTIKRSNSCSVNPTHPRLFLIWFGEYCVFTCLESVSLRGNSVANERKQPIDTRKCNGANQCNHLQQPEKQIKFIEST